MSCNRARSRSEVTGSRKLLIIQPAQMVGWRMEGIRASIITGTHNAETIGNFYSLGHYAMKLFLPMQFRLFGVQIKMEQSFLLCCSCESGSYTPAVVIMLARHGREAPRRHGRPPLAAGRKQTAHREREGEAQAAERRGEAAARVRDPKQAAE